MKKVLAAMVFAVMALHSAFGQNQTVTYQGVTLEPGDVINFYGGIFTTGGFLTYGHSALYLGVNPETKQRVFLDFATTEKYFGGPAKKAERAFVGRILPENDFWVASARGHKAFDVFRLRDRSTLNQARMLQAAKQIAIPANSFFFSKVCSTSVAAVLSKATRSKISAWTPDAFTGGRFRKHPDLVARILIQDLMDEHDLLPKNALVDITRRSCANPGSVTQAELNRLPRPYRENFHINADGLLRSGLGECMWVYVNLSMGERDAGKIRGLSVPEQPVAVRPVEQPAALNVSIPFEAIENICNHSVPVLRLCLVTKGRLQTAAAVELQQANGQLHRQFPLEGNG
ncbi:MAG: hypothetical protein JWM21_946 [Acidobacteria bacterium]|nr:hypothetical protein [Acidobacteriota bacterium]